MEPMEMQDPSAVASELDVAHESAKAAFIRKDLAAHMGLFSPDLRYHQADGRVIDREMLKRDVQAQFSRFGAVRSFFIREHLEISDGKAVETLSQIASACATAFFILHRTWEVTRKGRYVWRQEQGRWLIEAVEILEENVTPRGFTVGFESPSLG
jgi:hypothetical protein